MDQDSRAMAAAHILDRIADGETLHDILRAPKGIKLPSRAKFQQWLNEDKNLRERFDFARECYADHLADQALFIADSTDGKDDVPASTLQINTRKWYAARIAPQKYGERVNLAGVKNEPIEFKDTGEIAKLLAALASGCADSAEVSNEHFAPAPEADAPAGGLADMADSSGPGIRQDVCGGGSHSNGGADT